MLLTAMISLALLSEAQTDTTSRFNIAADTLQEVIVRAYEQNRKLADVAAPIGLIGQSQLKRFNNLSLLPAINTVPGVRMEERSPGSYRLNFRGSTLRSPFGVRNVKVYLNGIPFTDPGGNTYLNQLAYYNVQSMEIIKGPAGSLYGAGTGGALLIRTQPDQWQPGVSLNYIYGSYNLNNFSAQVKLGTAENQNTISYTHQANDGYRDHTAMRRDIVNWETLLKSSERQQMNAYVSYGDLYYQTPGALNQGEYNANPKAARPKVGATPSADQAKAAIYQKTILAGVSNKYIFNEHLENTTSIYAAYTRLLNPTFRNYEIRNEPHFGGRTVFTYKQNIDNTSIQVSGGVEGQKGFFKTEDFGNNNGQPDTVQINDDVNTWIYSVFAQADVRFPGGWGLTAGASFNKSFIGITQLHLPGSAPQNRTFSNEVAPRVALSKKITKDFLAYVSVSKGFSPPTVAEVLPSTGQINGSLQAEHGIDYEAGIKTSWLQERLYLEVNAFYFQLQNAIVVRKDINNADFYVNAGSTKQQGIESSLTYQVFSSNTRFISNARVWTSYTLNNFKYDDFKKDTVNFSNKTLPGVAANTFVAGVDLATRIGIYLDVTYYYSDRIALNDANTAYASSYNLLGGRIGYKKNITKKNTIDIFGGVDNLFNTKYSLGNDINAAAGRYFNAAAGINYFAGISLGNLFH
ncbi:MAG: TonB-dependent receptor [Bacteroidetes bacterium]|nr:TonB-dependent receptor [Bacteroidota bacterium]